jgi:hypothetical protein
MTRTATCGHCIRNLPSDPHPSRLPPLSFPAIHRLRESLPAAIKGLIPRNGLLLFYETGMLMWAWRCMNSRAGK